MSKTTNEVTVTEFLRPENSSEPVIYYINAFLAHLVGRLHAKGVEVCCDIYPDGMCRVYFYNSVDDIAISTSPKRSHSVASDLLEDLIRNFDFNYLL